MESTKVHKTNPPLPQWLQRLVDQRYRILDVRMHDKGRQRNTFAHAKEVLIGVAEKSSSQAEMEVVIGLLDSKLESLTNAHDNAAAEMKEIRSYCDTFPARIIT